MSKYGFVYIWRDRKHDRFYIGCHWGTEEDGYICSSRWMRKAYRRRPEDFKRRVIARIYTNRHDLLDEEHRWLMMMKKEEIGRKYYNTHNHRFGHWTTDPILSEEVIKKMSEASRNISDETRQKMSDAKKGKSLSPATQFKPGFEPWNKGKKGAQVAWNKGKKREEQPNYGKKRSEETRRKISEAQKGKPRPPGTGMSGKKHSQETRDKIAATKRARRESMLA
jgi:hypothetical protein